MNVEAVILAGGLSSRCNTNKLLFEFNRTTIIESVIRSFYGICNRIIVVSGHFHNEISPVLKQYDKVDVIYNKNYQDGMFSSVKTGVSAVTTDRLFITPGDYPLVKESTIKSLLNADSDFVYPTYNGIKGHPILLKNTIIPIILSGEYANLRDCLRSGRQERRPYIVRDTNRSGGYWNIARY